MLSLCALLVLSSALISAKPSEQSKHEMKMKREVSFNIPRLEAPKGVITIPTYSSVHSDNVQQIYRISPDLVGFTRVYFYFCDCDLGGWHPNGYDYIQLGGQLNRFWGDSTGTKFNVKAHNGTVDVEFSGQKNRTCQIAYSVYYDPRQLCPNTLNCGGSESNYDGLILTPNYPLHYNNNMECVYTFDSDTIYFHVCDCDLGYNDNNNGSCDDDFIRFGENGTWYCNLYRDMRFSVSGHNSNVELVFKSGSSGTHRGCSIAYFKYSGYDPSYVCPPMPEPAIVDWTDNKPRVDVKLTLLKAPQGMITTPNYPSNYDNNVEHIYRISPDLGFTRVYFFLCDCWLEEGYGCAFDYITFGHGDSRHCGYLSRKAYTAEALNGTVDVTFKSDTMGTKEGCQIAYSVYYDPRPSCPYSAYCGGNIYWSQGLIMTPDYPLGYDNSVSCVYKFEYTSVARFHVCDCDLGYNYSPDNSTYTCDDDFIRIGQDNIWECNLQRDARFTVHSRLSNTVEVAFKSGTNNNTHRGCSIAYTTSTDDPSSLCPPLPELASAGMNQPTTARVPVTITHFEAPTGVITTPNYPSNYNNNEEHIYRISSNLKGVERIYLYVCDCQLEPGDDCKFDSITFGYGGYRRCGEWSNQAITVQAVNGTVDIAFKSDVMETSRGCQIAYSVYYDPRQLCTNTHYCGGSMTRFQGLIMTPNYPLHYNNNMECVYTFESSRVRFYACDCDLGYNDISGSCDGDYIKFGANDTWRCDVPTNSSFTGFPINSTTGTVDLVFRSGNSGTHRGCSIAYSTDIYMYYPLQYVCPYLNPELGIFDKEKQTTATQAIPVNKPTTSPGEKANQKGSRINQLVEDVNRKEFTVLSAFNMLMRTIWRTIYKLP